MPGNAKVGFVLSGIVAYLTMQWTKSIIVNKNYKMKEESEVRKNNNILHIEVLKPSFRNRTSGLSSN